MFVKNAELGLGSFVESEVAGGSVVNSDGLPSYNNLLGTDHDKQVVGSQLAHNVLPWIHRIFSNLKRGRSASTMV